MKDEEINNKLSRRDFVKSTAVGVGAAALAGIGSTAAEAAKKPEGAKIPQRVLRHIPVDNPAQQFPPAASRVCAA